MKGLLSNFGSGGGGATGAAAAAEKEESDDDMVFSSVHSQRLFSD